MLKLISRLMHLNASIATQIQAEQLYAEAIALHAAKDYRKALPLMKQATEHHHPDGMAVYGSMLLLGHGCKEDGNAAVEWLQRAATAGNADAIALLGMALVTGKAGAPIDMERGKALLENAAAAGDQQSLKMLDMIRQKKGRFARR